MEKSTKKSGITLTLIGAFALSVCVFMYSQKSDFLANSVEVLGTVEETGSSGTGDSKTYSAILSFPDLDGNSRTSRITGTGSVEYLKKGESVALRYTPESPDSVVIDSFWEHWGLVLILGIVGLVMLIGGVKFLNG